MSKLYIEKYNPKTLEQLSYNDNVTNLILKISTKSDFSHLIFYGPEGAGKKTRIKVLLQSMFNESIHKLKTEVKQFKINSTNVQYTISYSSYHIEMTPSDSGNHDRHIVQNVIKETASTKIQNMGLKSGNNTLKHNNKIIVIHEADSLSKEAQSSLRRTMEKYSANCRLILCCNQISKIILPIRSRCLSIRVPSPSMLDITNSLKHIKDEESLKINDNQVKKIAAECSKNLRTGINIMQITSVEGFHGDKIFVPEVNMKVVDIVNKIIKEQSANQLKELREPTYDLITKCIPPSLILNIILRNLLSKDLSEQTKRDIIKWVAFYDKRVAMGAKPFIHLEALYARLMLLIYNHKSSRK